MKFTGLVASGLAMLAFAEAACDPNKNALAGKSASLVQEAKHYPDNPNIPITASGVLSAPDGCTLAVQDFVFLNPPPGVCRWYGVNGKCDSTSASAFLLSESAIGVYNQQNVTYTLTTVAGREATYDSVQCIKLFCEDLKFTVAYADFSSDKDGKSGSNAAGRASTSMVALAIGALGLLLI